jgi:hypothetical protein
LTIPHLTQGKQSYASAQKAGGGGNMSNIITDEAALLGLPNGSAFRGEERMASKRFLTRRDDAAAPGRFACGVDASNAHTADGSSRFSHVGAERGHFIGRGSCYNAEGQTAV